MKYLILAARILALGTIIASGIVHNSYTSAGYLMLVGGYLVWLICMTYDHLTRLDKYSQKVIGLIDEKYDLRQRLYELGDYAWVYERDYEALYGTKPPVDVSPVVQTNESDRNEQEFS